MSKNSNDPLKDIHIKIKSESSQKDSSEIEAQPIEGKVIENLKLLKGMIQSEKASIESFSEIKNPNESVIQLKQRIVDQFFEMPVAKLSKVEIPKKLQEECFNLIVQGWRKKISAEYSQTLTLLHLHFSKESFRAFVVAATFSVDLKALRLDHCMLGPKEAEMLAVFFRVHPSITVFHADDNPILDEGFAMIAEALEENKTLIHLSITKTRLTDKSIPAIIKLAEYATLHTITLKENDFSEAGIEKIKDELLNSNLEIIFE